MSIQPIPPGLKQKLWPHQVRAINFAIPYLRPPFKAPVALVRMPTGTGKTGVIATLSVAMPPPQWTLILTPWRNLCDQMILDLELKFWRSRGWHPPAKPKILRLYPRSVKGILQRSESNVILVATFATLVTIFKSLDKTYSRLSDRLSQVFVDEGHYEPAVEWGQAVKQLKKPTLLLTATPYRNDLKLFRVDADDVHHYTHKRAEADGIIRPLSFEPMKTSEPHGRHVVDWCKEFVAFWNQRTRKGFPNSSRAIICCASAEIVEQITRQLRAQGLDALGIHETFKNRTTKWLKRYTPRPEEVGFDIWVHQNKLTEGLDDSRFAILAIVNRIRNDRKLIQQIGRVLRRGQKAIGRAILLYPSDLTAAESWKNYRKFEIQPRFVDPERYHAILRNALKQQPEMEYFGSRFRHRFPVESPSMTREVLLRASSIVRRIRKTFDWEQFTNYTSDFLLLEDCILLGPERLPFRSLEDSRLWVYARIGNSAILKEHSHYEIRLGAMAAVKHNDLVFITDTEGVYPTDYFTDHAAKISPADLGRIFGPKTIPKEVSLTNAWPAGTGLLRSTIYSKDLTGTPAQLTDSVFVCGGARATVFPDNGSKVTRRQYAGFVRGRISEELRSTDRSLFSLREFVQWSKALATLIANNTRRMPEFFERYLASVPAPAVVVPKYFLLNLPDDDVEAQDANERPIDFSESITEFEPIADNNGNSTRFVSVLHYLDDHGGKHHFEIVAHYEPDRSRFRFSADGENSKAFVMDKNTEDVRKFAEYLNNNDDSYVVALDRPDVFYTGQSFYRIDYTHAETRLGALLIPLVALNKVTSEKGRKTPNMRRWDPRSLFGLIGNDVTTRFVRTHFGEPELVVCEDLGVEVGDFVCVNFSDKKIAFLHAKCDEGRIVSASALHDAVAQAVKNLGVFSRGGATPQGIGRWNPDSFWSRTHIRRWRFGSRTLPVGQQLWDKINQEILQHPEATREVWLVLGKTLDKSVLLDQLKDSDKRDAVTGQVIQLLSVLQASCLQVNVRLKVFCH